MCERRVVKIGSLRVPVSLGGAGRGDLFFIPGLGVPPDCYAPGLRRLRERLTVAVPDLSFGSHRTLIRDVDGYVEALREIARRTLPDAVWCGHSFGGLMALVGPRPGLALAPTVPSEAGWPGTVGRALRLQAREHLGSGGPRGRRWARRIMVEYVSAAVLRPGVILPVISDLVDRKPIDLPPVAKPARVVLGRSDVLYRSDEVRRYLDAVDADHVEVEEVDDGHDWPVTRPGLMVRRVTAGVERLSGALRDGRSP